MFSLNQNRYDELLRRVGDLKGPGSKVADVLTDLFPMIDVENLPGELYFLAGIRLAMGTSVQSASVGDLNLSQLFNPVDSGSVLTLTTVTMASNADQVFEQIVGTTPLLTNVGNNPLRDTRLGVPILPVGQIRNVQQVGGIPAFTSIRLLANVSFTLNDSNGVAILWPGTGYTIATTGANLASNVSFWWRERVFEPSENNF